jgi:hypothetical protein
MAGVELCERREPCFEGPSQSAKRRRLLLREFIFDQVDEGGIGLAMEHR